MPKSAFESVQKCLLGLRGGCLLSRCGRSFLGLHCSCLGAARVAEDALTVCQLVAWAKAPRHSWSQALPCLGLAGARQGQQILRRAMLDPFTVECKDRNNVLGPDWGQVWPSWALLRYLEAAALLCAAKLGFRKVMLKLSWAMLCHVEAVGAILGSTSAI